MIYLREKKHFSCGIINRPYLEFQYVRNTSLVTENDRGLRLFRHLSEYIFR